MRVKQTILTRPSMVDKVEIFGRNVLKARKARKLTAKELAGFLDISSAYVGLIERGERITSLELFFRICEFFGETVENMTSPNDADAPQKAKKVNRSNTRKLEAEKLLDLRRKTACSMINTFSVKELDLIIDILKNLKVYYTQ